MNKKTIIIFFIIIGISATLLLLKFTVLKKPITYINAIEQVYSQDIDTTSLEVSETSILTSCDKKTRLTATGNKANDFDSGNLGGVILWSAKQLFLSLDELNLVQKDIPGILDGEEDDYYMIYCSYEYNGLRSNNKIQNLYLFIDKDDFHIYIPEYYIEFNELDATIEFLEYEPNEITKNLIMDVIEDIFKIKLEDINIDEFNFRLNFGVDGKYQIDTYNGTFTKDLIMDGTKTIDFEIPDNIKEEITQLMNDVNIMSYPKNIEFYGIQVTPSSDYELIVTIDGTTKTIIWEDGLFPLDMNYDIPKENSDFLKIVEYIRDYIYSTEEYKSMPEASGGYD